MKTLLTTLALGAFVGVSVLGLSFWSAAPVSAIPEDTASDLGENPSHIQTILVAGGCFWCVEADLEKTPGVIAAVSGYAGGTSENPTYSTYGSGGHREVVEVTYDANQVSFEDILIVTLKTTDPTDDEGTFGDRGDKYSSAFYYETPEQQQIILDLIAEVDEFGPYDRPLAIDVEPRPVFWAAEDFHQDYYKRPVSSLRYALYRNASGRNAFIARHWEGNDIHSGDLPWRPVGDGESETLADRGSLEPDTAQDWESYEKPSVEILRDNLSPLAFRVTQQDGTERAFTSPYDGFYEAGIYVDILSGEPLFSSRDKYDSGTGWPSFTQPIREQALTRHRDVSLLGIRTEVRSNMADNHLGHVFTDGPRDRGGLRYCINGVALKFIPVEDMAASGYAAFLDQV